MGRTGWTAWLGLVTVLAGGCASGPLLENPLPVRPDPSIKVENPIYLPQGPKQYGAVFEKVLDIVSEYFEISYSNRYDGRIETFPQISPGLGQPWKSGSPDLYQRLEATLQTIRHRGSVLISTAEDGGFFVQVTVFKELEDLPRPSRATAGAASFRTENTLERQFEVIDPTVFESNWIPVCRDTELEQVILQRLKECM